MTERARFQTLVQGRPASREYGGGNFTPDKTRDPRFKVKFGGSSAWRHGDSAARRVCLQSNSCDKAISRSPQCATWQSDALGRRDTIAPNAVSLVNKAFERSHRYLPCTPPHKGRLRLSMYDSAEQQSSPFSSLRRGATHMKPALAISHTQRFASHKAYSMMSPPQSREGSPSRTASTLPVHPGQNGHMLPFGAHKRVQPTSFRDVLSNAANKPRQAWGFNEKPQFRARNVNRMSMSLPSSEGLKPAFNASSLIPAGQGPPSTAAQYHSVHHSPPRHHPAPPSTAPAGPACARMRSNSVGTDHFRQATPDQYKPLPSNRAQLPPVPPVASDPRPLKRSTLESHTSATSNALEAFSVQSFGPRSQGSVQAALETSPSLAHATASPLNPKAQPFVPQTSLLEVTVSTPSYPIPTATHLSSASPQGAVHTPGLSSHPCIDADLHSTPSTASPSAHLCSPSLGVNRTVSTLGSQIPQRIPEVSENDASLESAAVHVTGGSPVDSVPYAISPDPDSDVVVVEHAAGASTDQHITVHDPPSCVVVQETSIAGPSALEGSTIRDVMTEQQLHTQQEPGTSDNGGDARMASSTPGSVSLSGGNGGEPVKSIVNQLKENNFPMDSDADEGGSSDADEDSNSWGSIRPDDEEMSAEEDWTTVDHMDGYSDGTPRAQDISALTATPDTMSECSMHTAVGARGSHFAHSTSTVSAQFGGPGTGPGAHTHTHTHTIPTLDSEAPRTTGVTCYETITGNITLTESEPHSLHTAASSASVASRASVAPINNAVYGKLTAEELEDVFGDVNEHPNDLIVDGMRRLNDKYIALKKVGEGAYGKVFECVDAATRSHKVAIKLFRISPTDTDAEDVKRTARREAHLMESLAHPHIVNCKELFWIDDKVAIVMEFAPRNLLEALEECEQEYEAELSLGHQIDPRCKGLPKFRVREILLHLMKAVAFLHERDIVYRDIKPENVLLRGDGTAQLCDFGFARYFAGDKPGAQDPLTDYVGTRWYRAPELLLGLNQCGAGPTANYMRYTKAVDLWAIGCLMGELTTGDPLFPGDSDIDQLFKVRNIVGEITKTQRTLFKTHPDHKHLHLAPVQNPETLQAHFSHFMDATEIDFLEGLLNVDPKQRRSAADCLHHPYLARL